MSMKKSAHHPDRERQIERHRHHDHDLIGVELPREIADDVDGNHQRDRRNHAGDQHRQQERRSAAADAHQRIGGRGGDQHGDGRR